MTGKEIFKKAIKLEKTPRCPFVIMSGGVWAYKQVGKSLQDSFELTPEESSDFWVETNKKIRSDLIFCASGCNDLVLRALGAESDFSKVGVAASVQPMIKSASDVDKLDIGDIKKDPGVIAMLESTKLMMKKMGDETMLGISQWGPLTLAGLMIGASDFMMMLVKDKKAVKYIMDFTSEAVLEYWRLFLDAGCEHVEMAEPDASPDMISPKMFEKIALPHIQKTFQGIEGQAFSRMLHICGNTTKILKYIPESGADMFSMDWKVNPADAREALGGKVAFSGQIDPAEVIGLGTKEDVLAKSREAMEAAKWEEGGYILMPGCDLSPISPLENVQALSEVAYAARQEL